MARKAKEPVVIKTLADVAGGGKENLSPRERYDKGLVETASRSGLMSEDHLGKNILPIENNGPSVMRRKGPFPRTS